MSTAATQSYIDAQKVLQGYKTQGVDQGESDKYVQGAIKALQDDPAQFSNNVAEVATWAVQVDEAFNNVTKGLTNLATEFTGQFPQLNGYLGEWKGYNTRWVNHLLLSRDVASEQISVLTRFDRVFLDMVQSIETDQDRLDVIAELGSFASEDHGAKSGQMSQGFLNIKRDVEDFVVRFDAWVATTSAQLQQRAKELQVEIDNLKKEIQNLDKEIKEATTALLQSAAGAANMAGIVGLVVSGTTVAILVAQRIVQTVELSNRKKELVQVNAKQVAIAKIKSDFDGLRPDIALICEKLVLFAQIWSSVQSQTLRFQDTLKGGMSAVNNVRFKNEITLARKLAVPLKDGLTLYATNLASRK